MTEVVVSPTDAGVRLDVFLPRHLPQLSRRRTQAAIDCGSVLVNGRRSRKGDLLAAGDRVEFDESIATTQGLQPNPALKIQILYEDEALVGVDKPPGLPAHALDASETETVANFLVARYPEMRDVGAPRLEAGLVHRLDTQTSGVLLSARTAAAHAHLRRQFRQRAVTKDYLALVTGDVHGERELRHRIAAHRRDRRKVEVFDAASPENSGRLAITRYKARERYGRATLLALQIITGERHQIRAQLAAIGHPVIGDQLYGSNRKFNADRHLLHAARLIVRHPVSGEHLALSAPIPDDFIRWMQALKG